MSIYIFVGMLACGLLLFEEGFSFFKKEYQNVDKVGGWLGMRREFEERTNGDWLSRRTKCPKQPAAAL